MSSASRPESKLRSAKSISSSVMLSIVSVMARPIAKQKILVEVTHLTLRIYTKGDRCILVYHTLPLDSTQGLIEPLTVEVLECLSYSVHAIHYSFLSAQIGGIFRDCQV